MQLLKRKMLRNEEESCNANLKLRNMEQFMQSKCILDYLQGLVNRILYFANKIQIIHAINLKLPEGHIPSMHVISCQFYQALKIVETQALRKIWQKVLGQSISIERSVTLLILIGSQKVIVCQIKGKHLEQAYHCANSIRHNYGIAPIAITIPGQRNKTIINGEKRDKKAYIHV